MASIPGERVRWLLAPLWAAVLFGLCTLAACRKKAEGTPTLQFYCAAGIREPVDDAITQFEQAHNVKVQTDYAGSNVLLERVKLLRTGDLYMPGDLHYVEQAEQEGLIASSADVSYWVPVILVVKGNPKHIQRLADLSQPGIRVGVGDAEACAIGRTTVELLEKNGIPMEQMEPNVVFRSMTVNELGLQVKAGKLDATIVWDSIARQYLDAGEIVEIPSEQNLISTVPVTVLNSSEHPELAEAFKEFVTSAAGRAIFQEHGYTTEPPH